MIQSGSLRHIIVKECADDTRESGKKRRLQYVIATELVNQMQSSIIATINFHLSHKPIDDPIFVDISARIKFEFRVPVTFFVCDARGQHLDRKSTRLNSSHVSESRMPSSA